MLGSPPVAGPLVTVELVFQVVDLRHPGSSVGNGGEGAMPIWSVSNGQGLEAVWAVGGEGGIAGSGGLELDVGAGAAVVVTVGVPVGVIIGEGPGTETVSGAGVA